MTASQFSDSLSCWLWSTTVFLNVFKCVAARECPTESVFLTRRDDGKLLKIFFFNCISCSSNGLISGIGRLARIFVSMQGSLFTISWMTVINCVCDKPLRIFVNGVVWFCCAIGDSVKRKRLVCGVYDCGVVICGVVRMVLRGDWPIDSGDIRTLDDDATPSKCNRLRGELRRVIDVDFVGVRNIDSNAAVDDGILSGDQLIERRRPLWRMITENNEWFLSEWKNTTFTKQQKEKLHENAKNG